MSSEPIRIVLIDDHAVVRKGLRAFLDTYPEIEVVGEAGGGAEGVALVARVLPDVALMDLVMPEMDGIEATRQIKQVSPSTQVIVLTSYGEDERIFPAIKAGALSYL
ncbi:MAG: response regulator, partial [Chloroflexaceae bacterium]